VVGVRGRDAVMLRREVESCEGKWLFRAWLVLVSVFLTLGLVAAFSLLVACGRGGAPAPCMPQPFSISGSPSGGAGPCEVRR
jgi:hypothetical protein